MSAAVAEVAALLLDDRPRPPDAAGIGCVRGWRRRRKPGDQVRHAAQVGVAQAARHLVHGLDHAQPLAEHEELDRQVVGRLAAERGHLGAGRLPVLAVAGEARGEKAGEGVQRCSAAPPL